MENVVNLIMNNGMCVVIVAYFLVKDHKTTNQIISLMGEIKEVLCSLRAKEGGDNA